MESFSGGSMCATPPRKNLWGAASPHAASTAAPSPSQSFGVPASQVSFCMSSPVNVDVSPRLFPGKPPQPAATPWSSRNGVSSVAARVSPDCRRFEELCRCLTQRRRQVYTFDDLQELVFEAEQQRTALERRGEDLQQENSDLRHEVDWWSQRYLQKEKEHTAATISETLLQRSLQEALEREKLLEATVKELKLLRDQFQKDAYAAAAEAKEGMRQLSQSRALCEERSSELFAAQAEKKAAEADVSALQDALDRLAQRCHEDLQSQRDKHSETMAEAQAHWEHEEEENERRLSRLEQALVAAKSGQRAATEDNDALSMENAALDENNRMILLELQKAVDRGARIGVDPIYVGTSLLLDPHAEGGVMSARTPVGPRPVGGAPPRHWLGRHTSVRSRRLRSEVQTARGAGATYAH
eukprot:TRINITY_DN123211_c0_g1_i1.p2 TRINITY_DN123211_c0_g1~~TRINITY_DN123211_c0_g1_i1.p2  ORF type:complete len:413 (+),score=131.45 TRINITY_DN123211_c0_g1_i1:162-1400(+)